MTKKIVILGGGPGGYTAAIKAAQLGAEVIVIEKDKLGGTCLNRGCIPTKTLYRNAEILNILKNIGEFGIKINEYEIDIDKIHERKDDIVNNLNVGIQQLLKANNVEVIYGNAKFIDKNNIEICLEDKEIRKIKAEYIVIATGSKPRVPNIDGINIDGIFTSEEILNLREIPRSLGIIGGGVIGIEFAGIFNALGSEVTVYEYASSILSILDKDISKRLTSILKKKGIKIENSTEVKKIEKLEDNYILYVKNKKNDLSFKYEKLLVSIGREPFIQDMNLESTNINYNNQGINVNENFETNVKGIYAIGDVTGKMMLAHKAAHEGISAVEHIMGIKSHIKHNVVPNCIFTFPEVASVGVTEKELKQKSTQYKVSKFNFRANGKALALGEPDGFVKVITSLDDVIIGVHIIGPHASDLIHEGTLAISSKLKVLDISKTIHAHPTLSETFTEAVLGINNEAVHIVTRKK